MNHARHTAAMGRPDAHRDDPRLTAPIHPSVGPRALKTRVNWSVWTSAAPIGPRSRVGSWRATKRASARSQSAKSRVRLRPGLLVPQNRHRSNREVVASRQARRSAPRERPLGGVEAGPRVGRPTRGPRLAWRPPYPPPVDHHWSRLIGPADTRPWMRSFSGIGPCIGPEPELHDECGHA
jgi:hypothetical protein